MLLPFKPNGKALHVKGFLSRFAKTAQNQADVLSRLAKLGIPMVGVDPAIVLTYRDEYKEILGQVRGDFEVLTSQEWLTSQQTQLQTLIQNFAKTDRTYPTQQWYLFSHCTESTALPNSGKGWQQLFALFGQELKIENVGCCGMAGTFGHETAHLAMSKDIYALSWAKKLAGKDPHFCLATGYSCRSQVKRLEKWQPQHPVQALLSLLK